MPKFDRDHQGSWLSPAVVDRETVVLADDVGHIHRVALKTNAGAALGRRGAGDASAADHRRPGLDRRRRDRRDGRPARSARSPSRDLSPVGSWALEAPLAGRLGQPGDGCFVMDRAGGVMALGARRQADLVDQLEGRKSSAPRLVQDQSVWFLTSDGNAPCSRRGPTATELDRIALGILPDGRLAAGRATQCSWPPEGGRSAR